MRIKNYLTFLLCLLLVHSVRGQDDNVTEGFGFGNLQTTENLSSGVLNINLPVENALAPISIGYTTSGIRVNDRPGTVGLGWSLNVGGFIMRHKRGESDGEADGYSGENKAGDEVDRMLDWPGVFNAFVQICFRNWKPSLN